MQVNVSRRSFVAGSALAGGAIAASAGIAMPSVRGAIADEAAAAPDAEYVSPAGVAIDKGAVSEIIDCGVVVVGCGVSGLAASVQAAQEGASVITLEGQEVLGGNGMGVEGTFGVNSFMQQEQGIECDPAVVMQEELGKTQWCVDGLLYKDLMQAAADNIKWMVDDCGVLFSGEIDNYPFGAVGGVVDSFHWFQDGACATGYLPPMEAKARELGVDIRLNTRAVELYFEDDKPNGVYAIDAFGDLVVFRAPAVIICTGGFANDDSRLVKHGFNLDYLERIGTPGHYGDGINMLLAAGASEFSGVCYLKYNRISYNFEIATFGPFYGAFCSGGPGIWVNSDCVRFVDESCALRTGNNITLSHPIHNQNAHAYVVFDTPIVESLAADFADQAAEWDVDLMGQWDMIIEEGTDAWRADTIEELAEKAGLDPKALAATVAEYNAECEAGKDTWFGKDAEYLKPIATPPFYMGMIHEAMEGPLGGVVTNREFKPQLDAGGHMDNVFCTGLDGIMLYRDVYPIDVPGSASAECINGGRVAARQAAAIAAEQGVKSSDLAMDDRGNAKQVVMAAIDLFTTMDLGLTDEDSPATIAMSDPAFADFFEAVKGYKKVAGMDLEDAAFVATISKVNVATARADSQQANYRYALQEADVTVNGAHATYTKADGLVVA